MDFIFKCLIAVILALCVLSFIHVAAYYYNGSMNTCQLIIE